MKIGITSVIHPEEVLVDHILQYIKTPHAMESANFEHGRILLRGYRVSENMEIAFKTPREIRHANPNDIILFVAVVRNKVGIIPDGEMKILPGDIVYSLFSRESINCFLRLVNIEVRKSRKIIMTGDSYATMKLAEALEGSDNKVIYVDPDLEHAQKAAEDFDKIEVIHGDCTDNDLLRELNVQNASFFIAVSNASDYNMFSALLAKAEGAHETIVTATETKHYSLFHSIGVDHVINPRLTTAREILEIISRAQIGAAVKLSHVDIEAIRFTVDPDSNIAGKQIKEIAKKLKKGTIIGVIIRNDSIIIPDGETTIEANDHIIAITYIRNTSDLAKLFKPRRFRIGS